MKKICVLCKGKGWKRTIENWLFAPFTLGLSLIQAPSDPDCGMCDGLGFIDE